MFTTSLPSETLERLDASPAVQGLSGQPRYDIFMEEGLSADEWIGMMGVDFDNRQHLLSTAILADAIVTAEGFDEQTRYETALTAATHDAAESVLGDKQFHIKSRTDDEAEIELMGEMIADGRLLLTRDELTVVQRVMRDKHDGAQAPSGIAFDLSEVIGYQLSAVNAWRTQATHPEMTVEQRRLARLLAVNVTSGQMAVLFAYKDRGLKSPGIMLDAVADTMSEVFNYGAQPGVIEQHSALTEEHGFGHKADILANGFREASARWAAEIAVQQAA